MGRLPDKKVENGGGKPADQKEGPLPEEGAAFPPFCHLRPPVLDPFSWGNSEQ